MKKIILTSGLIAAFTLSVSANQLKQPTVTAETEIQTQGVQTAPVNWLVIGLMVGAAIFLGSREKTTQCLSCED